MGNMLITESSNIVYSRIIGYSQINEQEKIPLTTETRYRIGSITKMFTGAMIFQLIEEGKLTLNDTLDTFFPQIPNSGKITILQILAHRSGIPNVGRGEDSKTKPITNDEKLALIAKSTPDFEPDTQYGYSNSGYILLGYIIEKITGKSYQEALSERITSKIKLSDTYLGTGYIDVSQNECHSYSYFGRWQQNVETHLSIPSAAGAIISTPADLTQFIQALFAGRIVSKESLDLMMQKQLGMEAFIYHDKTFYGHAGGIDNFGSWLVYSPEENLTLAYTTNAKVYPVTKIIDGVFDIYWNKPFAIPSFEAMVVDPEILDQYIGTYSNPEAPVKFIIIRDGTTLCMQQNAQSAIPLEATATNKFKIDPPGIFFEFNASQKQLSIKRGGGERIFTKEE
ncbi:serine hydrolase domain-containing protein [Parabacteroides sp. PF5-9]|uniref:serine hydrolase domain-containing protein n=1 Tax=Parabacteroides sp. PF5-9 TaxID=1742404 RepID=UPI002475266A|nr:serine hydrolase domain-containing protein [Parabacteroides sp. PF5-9]